MDEALFFIENTVCSYDGTPENKVLHIDSLQIPKYKLIFLLGASGCGKSTLLETLGLMNNTVVAGNIFLHANDTDQKINIPDLWQNKNAAQLAAVRKSYYSFIFQRTNLMENFTAYENVCLSGMIKNEVAQEQVLPGAKALMEKIKLPESEVNLQTLAVNLSGGQRQRLAFARALNNNATILFGDEPTGDLDVANAHDLFEIVRSRLIDGLSAIVVSHDIDLAVKFADQIIVITKDTGKSYGEVKSANVFNRHSWEHNSLDETDTFKNTLKKLYRVTNEHTISREPDLAKTDTSISYAKLFLNKEGKALAGKKMANFLILSLMLICTFLAIGFANGSLHYLKNQLSDAFVNWVPVTIPFAQSGGGKITILLDELNTDINKKRFLYKQASGYVRHPLSVLDQQTRKFNYALSRSINVTEDADLLQGFILEKDNVIKSMIGAGFKDEYDVSVIVTSKFLNEFSYAPDANFIYCSTRVIDTLSRTTKDIPVKVPVRAIVKRLPGKYGIIYPLFFFQSLMYDRDNSFDSSTKTNNYFIFYETDEPKKGADLKNKLDTFFTQNEAYKKYFPGPVFQSVDTIGWQAGYKYEINFDTAFKDLALLNESIEKFKLYSGNIFDASKISRVFDYSGVSEYNKDPVFDDISVYFKRLDSVSAFAKFLYQKADAKNNADIIQVDDAKVKEKENYLFLSNVTKIISVLLAIFSTLAVCLFIFNLLKSHLSKVKMNIGTFKAMGLTDKKSANIYFKIMMLFISMAAVISFALASLLGYLINWTLSNNSVEGNNTRYFKIIDVIETTSLINLVTLLTVAIILVSTIMTARVTIKKLLSKTPGDLIYNR